MWEGCPETIEVRTRSVALKVVSRRNRPSSEVDRIAVPCGPKQIGDEKWFDIPCVRTQCRDAVCVRKMKGVCTAGVGAAVRGEGQEGRKGEKGDKEASLSRGWALCQLPCDAGSKLTICGPFPQVFSSVFRGWLTEDFSFSPLLFQCLAFWTWVRTGTMWYNKVDYCTPCQLPMSPTSSEGSEGVLPVASPPFPSAPNLDMV